MGGWRVICVVAALGAQAAFANPVVLLWNALGTPKSVTVSGRVLKAAPSQGSSTLSKNLRRLLSSNAEGMPVEISFANQKKTVTSGLDGIFTAQIEAPEGHDFPVGINSVTATSPGADVVSAVVDVIGDADFFVISDFDDTLAVSEVLEKRNLLRNALLKDESSQTPVQGMAAFTTCLRDGGAQRRAFALVSGSPVQFSYRTRRFLFTNHFPLFGEYLRNLSTETLSDYKQPFIRFLMKSIPNQVVLLGDSGEKDPEIYAQMRQEFPGRVKAIFIRNAGRTDDQNRFEGMTLFDTPETAAKVALEQKLITSQCLQAMSVAEKKVP